jgi:hypothetical protein
MKNIKHYKKQVRMSRARKACERAAEHALARISARIHAEATVRYMQQIATLQR